MKLEYHKLVSTFAVNFNLRRYNTGSAVVGNKAYFGPYTQENVGVFDTDTNAFSTIGASGLLSGGNSQMYAGAAAVGSKVVFAPYNYNVVLVLDTTDNSFSTVATVSGGGSRLYMGATALGTKVYMAPVTATHVGIFDVETNTFDTIALVGDAAGGDYRYSDATAVGRGFHSFTFQLNMSRLCR